MRNSRTFRSSRSPRMRCPATRSGRGRAVATTSSPSRSTRRCSPVHWRGISVIEPATILIVDDEPLNVDLLEQELGAAGYRTVAAASGEEAIALAAKNPPHLLLLDVMMEGIDGYETCRRLKASDSTRTIPVIFLTALADTFDKVRAFSVGAVDYVTKPFESDELLARVGVHVALRRALDDNGTTDTYIGVMCDA